MELLILVTIGVIIWLIIDGSQHDNPSW